MNLINPSRIDNFSAFSDREREKERTSRILERIREEDRSSVHLIKIVGRIFPRAINFPEEEIFQ